MNPENMTFEASMQRLEQIVRTMERGDAPLEESLKLFQEGTELVRSCGKLLEEAELRSYFASLLINNTCIIYISILCPVIRCGNQLQELH